MDPSVVATLVIGLILLTGIALLVAALRRKPRGGRAVEPSCGKCGYAVRGLASFTCPECGSDVREVGITTPAMSPGLGLLVWAALWTLFLPWPAMGLSALLTARALPVMVTREMRRQIMVDDAATVHTATARMTGRAVRLGQSGTWKPVPFRELTLDMLARGLGPLKVDLESGSWHYTDPKGKTVSGRGRFTPAVVEQYLRDAGVIDPDIQSLALHVHMAVEELPQSQALYSRLGGGAPRGPAKVNAPPALLSTIPAPIQWVGVGLQAFWVFVWLIGIVWIVRRHASAILSAR